MAGRWIQRAKLPHIVEFRWNKPVTLGAARIISGYHSGGKVIAPISDFCIQHHDGNQWRDSTAKATANTNPAWAATFQPVRTNRARLVISKTKDSISRIWEVEFYPPVRKSR